MRAGSSRSILFGVLAAATACSAVPPPSTPLAADSGIDVVERRLANLADAPGDEWKSAVEDLLFCHGTELSLTQFGTLANAALEAGALRGSPVATRSGDSAAIRRPSP